MGEMDEEIDMKEVKKTLEDAGLFEPNIPDDVLVAYYKAVRDSENTASEESETRRLNESQEELIKVLDESLETRTTPSKNKDKSFIPKVWTSEKKLLQNDVPEHNNNHNAKEDNIDEIISDLPKDATKITFGFNEMVKDSEHTLNIITHELQFVPIHNSQQFLKAGTALKAKMLYSYHTKVNKMKGQLARMSFYPAPLPNVTSTTDTFPDFSTIDFQETYICRSGRQTKRKVYKDDEDEDSLDGTSHKKSKNSEEQEWLSKTVPNKVSIRSNKKSDPSQASVEPERTNSMSTEGNNENAKLANKLDTKTPSRKLNNSEIMKRSSLFVDSPKPRCESMFEKLKEDEQKKLKEEKTMELFHKTLENLDEEHNSVNKDANEDIITVDDDEPIKRRVVPPVPGRRAINNRKRNKPDGLAPLEVTVSSPLQKRDTTVNQTINSPFKEPTIENATKASIKKRLGLRKVTPVPLIGTESLPSTSKLPRAESREDEVTCPICNGSFHKDEIQEHASSCGDEPITRSSSKISRITCEICDKVVNFDTSYEVHVKECIAKVNK